MQYVCMVYQEESKIAALSDSELEQMIANCMRFIGELTEKGQHVLSSGLQSVRSAATVRHSNTGTTVLDGPFAETKEVLGGFTIIEARDLNEAIQIASRFPTRQIGCVEVRPVMNPMDEHSDPLDRRMAACVLRAVANSEQCQDAVAAFSPAMN